MRHAWQKILQYYRNEEVSKVLIAGIVLLTGITSYFLVSDGGLRAYFVAQNTPVPPEESSEDLRFRQCVWNQNSLIACEGGNLFGIDLPFLDKEIELGEGIVLRPGDLDDPNGDNVSWSGYIAILSEVQEFSGSASIGNTRPGGINDTLDYSQAGTFANRLSWETGENNPDQLNLNNQFAQPYIFNGTTQVEGTDFNEDSEIVTYIPELGDNFAIYPLAGGNLDYEQYWNHENQSNPFVGIAVQFKEGAAPAIPTDINVADVSNSVSEPADFLVSAQEFFESIGDEVGIAFAGNCSEYGEHQAISTVVRPDPADKLPRQTNITNAGEVYSFENKDALCEAYLDTEAGDDIFDVNRPGNSGFGNEDFFDVACKPECQECETFDTHFSCSVDSSLSIVPSYFPNHIRKCINPQTEFNDGSVGNYQWGSTSSQYCDNDAPCKVDIDVDFDSATGTYDVDIDEVKEMALDEDGNYKCQNGGIGRDAEDIDELNKNGFDSDYSGDICKVNGNDGVRMDNDFYDKAGLFEREVDGGAVVCKENANEKPLADTELNYWYEEPDWQPPYTTRVDSREGGGVRPWCWLNWDEDTELTRRGGVSYTPTEAEIPYGATALVTTKRKIEQLLPAKVDKTPVASEPTLYAGDGSVVAQSPEETATTTGSNKARICFNNNLGVMVRTKIGVLDPTQCEYVKLVNGIDVEYMTIDELVSRDDLPFNQGTEAQMCQPEIRVEPACEYSNDNPPPQSGEDQGPPTQTGTLDGVEFLVYSENGVTADQFTGLVGVTPAAVNPGEDYYKVVKIEWQDDSHSGGNHNIFVNVIGDTTGVEGFRVYDGAGNESTFGLGENYPMFASQPVGWLNLEMLGVNADVVNGLGMGHPGGNPGIHTNFIITYQKVSAGGNQEAAINEEAELLTLGELVEGDVLGVAIEEVPTVGNPVTVYNVFPYLGNVIGDFDEKFSRVYFNTDKHEEGESELDYVERVLGQITDTSGAPVAHICAVDEVDIMTEYLYLTGAIDEAIFTELVGAPPEAFGL